MQIGDIWTWSYMYTSRSNHYARVTRFTDKTIWLQPIGKRITSHDGYGQNGYDVADPSTDHPYKKKPIMARLKNSKKYGVFCYVDNALCEPWNGNEQPFYTD